MLLEGVKGTIRGRERVIETKTKMKGMMIIEITQLLIVIIIMGGKATSGFGMKLTSWTRMIREAEIIKFRS